MTADPYARLDAAYLLGGLDADERLAYEAHLATCRRCRAILMPSGSGPNPADLLVSSRRSWLLAPGRKVIFTRGTVLAEAQIKNLQITQPNGRAILALTVPRLLRTPYR